MTSFLIWSNQQRMWWRAAKRGYTDYIEEAGRYTRDEAEAIVSEATLDGTLGVANADPVTGVVYVRQDEVMVLAPEDMPAVTK